MDEPPIKLWVRGAEEWRYEHEWPLPSTKWEKYYLGTANSLKRETPPSTDESPDSFDYKPVMPVITDVAPLEPFKPEHIAYTTEAFTEDTLIIGPIALYLYASINSDDATWIVKLKDISPDGTEVVLSRGWLKASHKELDENRSQPWQPYHPHTRSIPVVPKEINEYAFDIRPICNLFKAGHRIKVEIWGCDYPSPEDGKDYTLNYPMFSHLANPKETVHTIHHTPHIHLICSCL